MFTHVMIGSNDLERARDFYDATFAALGGELGEIDARGRLLYAHRGGRLMITKPIDGNPATAANGGTIGIAAASRDHVLACIRPAPRMVGRRSRAHLASARTEPSSPTFVIRTETSSPRALSRRSNTIGNSSSEDHPAPPASGRSNLGQSFRVNRPATKRTSPQSQKGRFRSCRRRAPKSAFRQRARVRLWRCSDTPPRISGGRAIEARWLSW